MRRLSAGLFNQPIYGDLGDKIDPLENEMIQNGDRRSYVIIIHGNLSMYTFTQIDMSARGLGNFSVTFVEQ